MAEEYRGPDPVWLDCGWKVCINIANCLGGIRAVWFLEGLLMGYGCRRIDLLQLVLVDLIELQLRYIMGGLV